MLLVMGWSPKYCQSLTSSLLRTVSTPLPPSIMRTQYTTHEEKAAAALRNVRAHRDRQKYVVLSRPTPSVLKLCRAKQAAQAARRRPGKGSAPHLSGVS